jgi:hypothetical protein
MVVGRLELVRARAHRPRARRAGLVRFAALDGQRERVRALHRQLEARWIRRRDQAVDHPNGRIFVPDDMQYSLSNNSVHELARWLEALGANVSGSGVTANFKLRSQ